MTRPEDKHAWTAKIGSKGQIVIPKDAREIFNFKPGDNVLLLGDEKQGIAIMRSDLYDELVEKVFGEQEQDEGDNK
ncbi:MAG TPA: AbrB/MazE/SpoVT family DNA-binding domain-containing protein [Lentibacillus sp.]|uniref:AbrB/MazE/SpoVT family DNA-binding domain-containing protein n=1 Tax=Lentibacillus sp. TaxID=1925746 RepID=UPI002B4AF331|nr:AbrB/MazE/SpoVT family DNA-binding domain-containing protein [Lentibacillus sp.]HLR63594.1 AbrB/MazE/SpoVT family DNA-binding domain-containing protein [Lentibacillus sp.]